MHVTEIVEESNLVPLLEKESVEEIGDNVVNWFESDVRSRSNWEMKYRKWVELASQVMKEKNTPWRRAANIKYPLLTQAALNFNARVLPALTPNAEPIGATAVGDDPEGTRYLEAAKVQRHMNYQLLNEIDDWEEDFDKLTLVMSITGQEYKKTYFSYDTSKIKSEFVSSGDLVLHYWYTDFINTRKTHKMLMSYNDIMERMNMGLYSFYSEEELGTATQPTSAANTLQFESQLRHGISPTQEDDDSPHLILDHHGWLDLDGDGYKEPYRVVVHHGSKKVLQITPRFTMENVILDDKGDKVIKITPIEYFTKYGMIPNPDGSNYDIGFGVLLTPINETVNTSINQLLDAGTLATMQSGFIGKGIRLKGGSFSVQPGKWPVVNSTGGNLKDNIVPLPIKEPSNVILQLLSFMVQAGKELSATTDIFSGQHPGQNTKAGVTQAVRDEGLKVFNATYKRIRRSMKKEMLKLFKLNNLILASGVETPTMKSAQLFGVTAEHYDVENVHIEPSADPAIAIKEQRIQKDMGSLELISTYGGNIQEGLKRVLQSMEVSGIEELMKQPEPQPDPSVILDKAEIERKIDKDMRDAESKQVDQMLKLLELQLKAKESGDKQAIDIANAITNYTKLAVDASNNGQRDNSTQSE